jgi:hypothetical protein
VWGGGGCGLPRNAKLIEPVGKRGRDLGVAGADDVGARELGGEADEEAAERLVAVEAAVVGPHSPAAPSAVLAAGGGGRVDPQPLRRGGSRRRERRHGGERAPDLGSPRAEERRRDGSLQHPPGGAEHTSLGLPVRRERWMGQLREIENQRFSKFVKRNASKPALPGP